MISHTKSVVYGDNALKFILYCELRVQNKGEYVPNLYKNKPNVVHIYTNKAQNVFNMSHKCQRNELKRLKTKSFKYIYLDK